MARFLWALGLSMVLGGLGTVAYGVLCVVVAAHERVDTAAELEIHGARLTKGVLLVAGGVFACMVGGYVCRAAWHQGGSNRLDYLDYVLLVGGYLLVAAGLAVCTRHTSIAGFYVGFGIQVVGAVAVGIGGSRAQDDRCPRPLSDPGTAASGGAATPSSRRLRPAKSLPAIGSRYAGKAPRGDSDATPPG